jgi:phosphotransferase system  glucose/maltose/N-acetylglucosamine-specific IIC component
VLAVAVAALVVGVIFLFIIPWVGIPIGILGAILLGVYLFGAGRRATSARG